MRKVMVLAVLLAACDSAERARLEAEKARMEMERAALQAELASLKAKLAAVEAEKAAAPPAPAEPNTYEEAQDAYVHGHYKEAIAKARTITPTEPKAWRIVGASACFLSDKEVAKEALSHLDAPGKQFLTYVCSRNKIALQ